MGLLCPLRATPCFPEFNLSDGEEEGVVVVEEVVIPEDDVVYVGRTTNILDLQEQQETCMYMYMYGESLFALTLPHLTRRLGMSIWWQSNSIPIRAVRSK